MKFLGKRNATLVQVWKEPGQLQNDSKFKASGGSKLNTRGDGRFQGRLWRDLASPVGCGVQETEQRAKRNLWAEAAGMHRRGRRL